MTLSSFYHKLKKDIIDCISFNIKDRDYPLKKIETSIFTTKKGSSKEEKQSRPTMKALTGEKIQKFIKKR